MEYVLERDGEATETYPEATKQGYSFVAWVDAEGNTISANSLVQDKTYYASYIDDVPPVINVEVTKEIAASQTVTITAMDEGSGVAAYYFGTENPVENAVEFTDTNTAVAEHAGTYYYAAVDSEGNVASGELTFFALSLNLNGGSFATDTILLNEGMTVALTDPEKTGYSGTWIDDATGNVVSEAVADGERTYTVQWTPNSYVVSFDANGSTCDVASTEVVFDASYGAFPTPATRNGYTFNGWYTLATGGTQVSSDTVVDCAKNHTLYAQWTYTHVHTSSCYKTTTCGQHYECRLSAIYGDGPDWPAGTPCYSHVCPSCGGLDGGGYGHAQCSGGTCTKTTTTKICGLP